jgi:hypothetical protein
MSSQDRSLRMDDAAVIIQATMRCACVRARYSRIRRGFVRLQALSRGKVARGVVGRTRLARRALTGWVLGRRFAALRRAVRALQAAWRARGVRRRYATLRTRLRCLLVVARSFIRRKRRARLTIAAIRIQRGARPFLARRQLFWRRTLGALLLQSLWRGVAWRRMHSSLVFLLQKRTAARIVNLRLARLQAVARGRPVRSAYALLRASVVCVQVRDGRNAENRILVCMYLNRTILFSR